MEPEPHKWIEKRPLSIHISRKEIFKMAVQQLCLYIKEEAVLPIRENDFAAIVEVVGLKAHGASQTEPIKFYGNFSCIAQEAIDSAHNEALKFLLKKGLIVIDDFNYASLQKTKSHLTELEIYLMFSEDSESMLENELDFKVQGYKRLGSILEIVCKEASTILPRSVIKYKNPQHDQKIDMITCTGYTSSTDSANKVALSFVEMGQIIRLHDYEIKHGDRSTMKEYWNRAAERDDD